MPIDLSTNREIKQRGRVLLLGGTHLKFVTGPRLAHERAQKAIEKRIEYRGTFTSSCWRHHEESGALSLLWGAVTIEKDLKDLGPSNEDRGIEKLDGGKVPPLVAQIDAA